jgi:ATP-dependent DNA helicase RecQ
MEAHTTEAQEMGLKAYQLPSQNMSKEVLDADILFASPEYWTGKAGCQLLQSLAARIIVIATDEVHVVPKWGQADKKKDKKIFRVAYGKLRDLRSYVPGVPYLALTATASVKTRLRFQKHLGLKSPHLIIKTPDRPNIKMSVRHVTDASCMDFVIDDLAATQLQCPRTIIYCKTIKDCTELYARFDKLLDKNGYTSATMNSKSRLFCMYFHDTLESKKRYILEDLLKDHGHYRVVIATNALGMGVDIKNANRIIHFGPPRDIEDYMQEMGRAGRTGADAEALLFYKSLHLLGSSDEMRTFVKNDTTCRRQILIGHFVNSDECIRPNIAHQCCDICEQTCDCGEEHEVHQAEIPKEPIRTVEEEDKELLMEVISVLKGQVGNQCHAFGVPVWAPSLTDEILAHCAYMDSLDYVALHLPVMHPQLAVEIYRAVCEVFDEDFRYDESEQEYVQQMSGCNNEHFIESLLSSIDPSDLDFPDCDWADAFDEDTCIDMDSANNDPEDS